ncbi:iron-sulfur cluster biosynthesis family protein [Lactococcus muris]|uniref:Iron-sulfur cluster biosynthesis family protein n=1 Tax=Lactococcus muris TaxID=2941330 RepID=A0ABV4D577_9LACT|nr:hypothetical protein [Lactococcus garvieae]
MKFIFDKEVGERLVKFENADFVLDFDHELSEKNESVDACAGGISRYRLLAIDKGKLPEVFDAHLDSEFGPIYFKKWGEMFWGSQDLYAKVEGSYNLIALKTEGEYLSHNLLIVDYRGKL